MVVESFSKWSAIFKYRRPTSIVTVNFLHELFTRFGVPDTIMSDNGTQFTSNDVHNFSKYYAFENITMLNGLLICSKKTNVNETKEVMLQQFLRIYRLNPNPNTASRISPVELIFTKMSV